MLDAFQPGVPIYIRWKAQDSYVCMNPSMCPCDFDMEGFTYVHTPHERVIHIYAFEVVECLYIHWGVPPPRGLFGPTITYCRCVYAYINLRSVYIFLYVST